LDVEFTVSEIRAAVHGMNNAAAVGAFGLDISIIKLLLD
jgi:hypothetical protein